MAAKHKIARDLTFHSLSDIVEDAHRIAEHPNAVPHGNWTPAQNIWHVGTLLAFSAEGFPFTAPFHFRILGALLKNRFLSKTTPTGFKAPQRIARHTEPTGDVTMDQALAVLDSAYEKAKQKGCSHPSPVLGALSDEEWVKLHCRHAEMHFGLIELAPAQSPAIAGA